MSPSTDVYSVTELVGELRNLLESSYRSVWVEGEISSLATPASGHLYFSLKEANAVIRCAFFRNRRAGSDTPKDGMQVLIRGQISVYENRGDLQLIVTHLEPAGEGALRRAFELLKKKLLKEGLFDQEHKQELPLFPKAIGVVTSASGAALHDIRITLKRRFPLVRLIVYPCLVQGGDAARSICEMIEIAAKRQDVDVLLIARGGGSLEDLQAFNEESVARAIFACTIPTISGVGHETDLTIADLVADHRAATPTAAAEMVSPLIDDLARDLVELQRRLISQIEWQLNQRRQQIDYLTSKLVHPSQKLEHRRLQCESLTTTLLSHTQRLLTGVRHQIERSCDGLHFHNPAQQLSRNRQLVVDNQRRIGQQSAFFLSTQRLKLHRMRTSIQLMSPLRTLERGYSILKNDSGKIVTSVNSVEAGQDLRATVSDGEFGVKVAWKQ